MPFYNPAMLADYRTEKRNNTILKILLPLVVYGLYEMRGFEVALLAVGFLTAYQLIDIALLLRYQVLMKEKQIGLHDIDQ